MIKKPKSTKKSSKQGDQRSQTTDVGLTPGEKSTLRSTYEQKGDPGAVENNKQ